MAYIGSAEDARRIRKQEEEREKQKLEFEKRKQAGESNVDGAGLRQFGAGTTDVRTATLGGAKLMFHSNASVSANLTIGWQPLPMLNHQAILQRCCTFIILRIICKALERSQVAFDGNKDCSRNAKGQAQYCV